MKKELGDVTNLIQKIGGKKVKFIILYGSVAMGKQTPRSDIDIAVFYEGSKEQRFQFRLSILSKVNKTFDVQTFQDLPLYIRKEVLNGRVLYCDNTRFLHEEIRKTNADFEDFKTRFYDYIRGGTIA